MRWHAYSRYKTHLFRVRRTFRSNLARLVLWRFEHLSTWSAFCALKHVTLRRSIFFRTRAFDLYRIRFYFCNLMTVTRRQRIYTSHRISWKQNSTYLLSRSLSCCFIYDCFIFCEFQNDIWWRFCSSMESQLVICPGLNPMFLSIDHVLFLTYFSFCSMQ